MSINLGTMTNHRLNPPIEAKFGLHFKRLGTLPNATEWAQIKSYIQSYSPIRLLSANIQPELDILLAHPDYILSVRVPTLGFTDLAFDYDMRPWFLSPVALNGHIAQTAEAKAKAKAGACALFATDIAHNTFKLCFDSEGKIDYDQISEQAKGDILFTTLKNIQYHFSLGTLLGLDQNLEGLTEKERLAHAGTICFFPPPIMAAEYEVELSVLDANKNSLQKRTLKIDSESQSHLFVSHFETLHSQGPKANSKDYLSIKAGMYVDQELPFSRYGYKIKIQSHSNLILGKLSTYTQPVAYYFKSGMAYNRVKPAIHKQGNLYEYVQFYGLSPAAMKQIVQVVISKERFFKNHLASSVQENKKDKKIKHEYNNYYLYPDLIDTLYDLVTEACAHKTIPLYGLSESFELSSVIFSKLTNLDASEWDAHDKWVFERMMAEQLISVRQDYDPMEVGFEWVDKVDRLLNEHPTDIDIQNNIEIFSGKLSTQQRIEIELYLEDISQSAFDKYEADMPSLLLSKTLESTEFNQQYGKNFGFKNSLSL